MVVYNNLGVQVTFAISVDTYQLLFFLLIISLIFYPFFAQSSFSQRSLYQNHILKIEPPY